MDSPSRAGESVQINKQVEEEPAAELQAEVAVSVEVELVAEVAAVPPVVEEEKATEAPSVEVVVHLVEEPPAAPLGEEPPAAVEVLDTVVAPSESAEPEVTQMPVDFPNKTLLLTVCAAGIGGSFQYGYNLSIINAPTQSVQNFINQTWIYRYDAQITEDLLTLIWSTIVSIFAIGRVIGSLVGGALTMRFGRKGALLLNNTFALLAALMMGISRPTGYYELLVVGRLLSGVNAGVGVCVQPLYLGEIAPKALRGGISMGTAIFLTGGILTGQVIGLHELLGKAEHWPILLSTTCIPAILQLVILPWFPESPRFLLLDRGDEAACTKALKQLHGEDDYQREMEDLEKERISTLGVKAKKPWELFSDHSLRWQLITVILINCAEQLSGIDAIYFYASNIFRQAGIPEDKLLYATVGIGACECLTTLTCGMLIDSLGRRALIIGGYTLMVVWCICVTITLSLQELSPWVPYLSMACVFAFILSFGMGPGGVTNILTMELFTQTARPAANVIGGCVNGLSFFFIAMVFSFIVNGLQQYCFLVFLAICSLVAIYIFFIVPETKNKTFLEIQEEFLSLNTSLNVACICSCMLPSTTQAGDPPLILGPRENIMLGPTTSGHSIPALSQHSHDSCNDSKLPMLLP